MTGFGVTKSGGKECSSKVEKTHSLCCGDFEWESEEERVLRRKKSWIEELNK